MKTLACIVLMVAASTIASAQSAGTCPPPGDARQPVVEAFRVINTVEVGFRHANGRFADISELMNSPEMKRVAERRAARGNQPFPLGSPDDPLPGYTLRLIVAADAKSYALTATKKDEPCKLLGATTDERGVIYLMEPLR